VGFLVGADAAYAGGDTQDGQMLQGIGGELIDLAVGAIPVLSSVANLAHVVSGMATGKDLLGNEMKAGDYALCGVSMILGLLPSRSSASARSNATATGSGSATLATIVLSSQEAPSASKPVTVAPTRHSYFASTCATASVSLCACQMWGRSVIVCVTPVIRSGRLDRSFPACRR
jgi:hypothetical protein